MLKLLFSRCSVVLTVTAVLLSAERTSAQQLASPLNSGFEKTSGITATVDEMLGVRQPRSAEEPVLGPGFPDLWMSEIQMKPVRMRRMSVVDPETGRRSNEIVWYLLYRLIPKDYTAIAGDSQDELRLKLQNPAIDPGNPVDARRSEAIVTPEFTIITDDNTGRNIYRDQVNLEVEAEVLRREFLRNRQFAVSRPVPELHNSVDAIGAVPEVVDMTGEEDDPLAGARYGVAVWRNVDPRTDFFTLYVSGLSNAFRITTSETGELILERKIVIQKFRRPGDEFLQDETEFRFEGDPAWEYRQDDTPAPDAAAVQILRNQDEAEPAGAAQP